jgi:hypothetical protein
VTSVDVDPHLTKAAGERLDSIGLHPGLVTCDATGPLPGSYDRIISTVAVGPCRPLAGRAALLPVGLNLQFWHRLTGQIVQRPVGLANGRPSASQGTELPGSDQANRCPKSQPGRVLGMTKRSVRT